MCRRDADQAQGRKRCYSSVILSKAIGSTRSGLSSRRTGVRAMAKNLLCYISTNRTRTLYIGVTNDLVRRVYKQRESLRADPSLCSG
jgi:hypothetical protein